MPKYNRTQIAFIIKALNAATEDRWKRESKLRKTYMPKKPKAVTEYERKCADARERAEREAAAYRKEVESYILDIEQQLTLDGVDFDLSAAISKLKSI